MNKPQLKHTPAPSFDEATIRDHVSLLHERANGIDGMLVVSTFFANAGDKPGPVTHHHVGDVNGMVEAIMAHSETPGVNVYTGLHLMRSGLERGRRGSVADIIAVLGVVVDLDSDTGKAGEMPVAPDLVLETSPGNFQPFILFDRPATPNEAREIGLALREATGADHGTIDPAHVWRIPGTLNWPGATKLARGRSPEPVAVIVAEPYAGTVQSVADLKAALAPWAGKASASAPITIGDLPDVGNINVGATVATMLVASGVGNRSEHAAAVVEQLAYDGHTAEQAAALFLASTGDWFGRYSSPADAERDFSRLWAKFGLPHMEAREAGSRSVEGLLKPKVAPVAANDNMPKWPGIISSGDFVRGFRPPDYHVDGVVQAGFVYSVTASSGTGKTAILLLLTALTALGRDLGTREVRKGRAIYFAGENPDDVAMRWIAQAHHMDFDPESIDVHFIPGVFSIPSLFAEVAKAVEAIGGAELVIVDTSAAYFQGADENGNVEMGRHARDLRQLTTVDGHPCVLVACHPTKSADQSNLLPRGGGAFIAEMDGNLTCSKVGDGTVKLHWQGKHRGPDFEPVVFDLQTVTAPLLKDSRGRDIPTVMATAMSDGDVRSRKQAARNDEDEAILRLEQGATSSSQVAESAGWMDKAGKPHKRRAQTTLDKLRKAKLAECVVRKGWRLTSAGEEAATEIRAERRREQDVSEGISRMVKRTQN